MEPTTTSWVLLLLSNISADDQLITLFWDGIKETKYKQLVATHNILCGFYETEELAKNARDFLSQTKRAVCAFDIYRYTKGTHFPLNIPLTEEIQNSNPFRIVKEIDDKEKKRLTALFQNVL